MSINPNFLKAVRNSSTFGLICGGRYDEAVQVLEEELSKGADFASTFETYASVLLISDQFVAAEEGIASFRQKILKDKASSCLSAAILQFLEREEAAKVYLKRFEDLGGSPEELETVSAYVAQTGGNPTLHMDHLLARTSLPDVDRDKAFLKYLRVCLQYGELDRADAVRSYLNKATLLGQYSEALLDALVGDGKRLTNLVQGWLSDPTRDAQCMSTIDSLWTEAGMPNMQECMRQAFERWNADSSAFAIAFRHHFVRLKGSKPNGSPTVEKLRVEESNFTSIALALIDHGYLDNASSLIDTLHPLHDKPKQAYGESLKKLISKLRTLNPRREIIVDQPELDWLLSEPGDSGKLCIVFTGLNGQVGIGGIQILDHFLASLGYQVLYVRDFNRLAFANGIVSKGPDKQSSIKEMLQFIEQHESADPVIFGVSRGAAAAIEYGLKLKASKILTFGYQGWENSKDRWRIGDARAALFNARYHQHQATQSTALSDLMNTAEHEHHIEMFYQRLNLVDAYHARTLPAAKGLRIHPLNGSRTHSSLLTLMLNDDLREHL